MAWRCVENLMGTKKSRSRKDTAQRRLAFERFERHRLCIEQLERRDLLYISIAGTIAVSNLACATDNSNVPVRGIHVHAWIGGNNTYSTSQGMNGTGTGGICADAYTDDFGQYCLLLDPNSTVTLSPDQAIHIVAIAQSRNGTSSGCQYQVIQPSPGIGTAYATDPTLVYTFQFDDHSASGGSMFADLSHDLTLAAPPVDKIGDLSDTQSPPEQAALAFAAFSIAETSYDFATTVLHAKLAPLISIVIPPLPGDITSASGSALILLKNNALLAPDAIAHEFGHCVSASGGFEAPSDVENNHYAQSNQRTLSPTTPVTKPPTPPNGNVTSSDLGIAWNEGFADYFAVACKTAISTAGLNIWQLETDPNDPRYYIGPGSTKNADYYSPKIDPSANVPGGWGEDNEISLMRILWAYANSFIGASDAELYQDLTVLDVFQNMTTLNDFWNVMHRGATTDIANPGTIFQNAGVSPVANFYTWVNGTTAPSFTFQLPKLHVADDPNMALYRFINVLTFSTVTISVFDANAAGQIDTPLWSVTANVTMVDGTYHLTATNEDAGVFATVGYSGDDDQYAQFTYTLTAADFQKFRSTGSGDTRRYFVVSGSSTTTDNNVTTGPYWGAPTKFGVHALAGTGNPNWPSETPEMAGAIEGAPETGVIDAFTDPDWPGTPDAYSASIAWENGSVTTVTGTSSAYGQIVYKDTSDPSQGFEIIGSQTYAEVGLYAVRTSISEDGTPIGILDCDITVTEAAPQSPSITSNLQFTVSVPPNT